MNMKFWNAGSGKPEDIIHVVKNLEAVTIPVGTPVVYAMSGTDDGLGVILPSSSTAARISVFCAGVTIKAMEPGKMENVQCYGFNRKTALFRGSRAASTAAWPTMAAMSLGDVLAIDQAGNGFISSASAANSAFQPMAVLAEAVASGSGFASSNNGQNPASALSYYQLVKTFLRFM